IPLPNDPQGGVFNYVANKVDVDRFNDYVAKVDYHFSDSDNVSIRYLHNRRFVSNPFAGSIFPAFGKDGIRHFSMAGVNFTHTFSPSVINQSMVSFSRKRTLDESFNFGTSFVEQFGITGITKDPVFSGFPRIRIDGFPNTGDANNLPLDWAENDYHFSNTMTIIKGQHNLRLGGEMIRSQFAQLVSNNARGVFRFRGRWTGDSFGDFLIGFLNNTNRRVRTTKNHLFSRTWAGFFQDDWKITPNLTLNLGVRWDLFVPPIEQEGNWSNFDPDTGQIILTGDPNFPESLIFMDKNNFAPRLGFAWRPFSSRTVIRMGIGQFYGLSLLNPIRNSLGRNPPFTILQTFGRSKKLKLPTWDDPFADKIAKEQKVNNPHGYEMRAPSANLYQYNLTIEQQFAQDLVMELGYVGSKGTHLGRRYNINQTIHTPLDDGSVDKFNPYPEFGGIQFYAFEADSNYHAFQATFRKRGRGLNYRLNYVFSKTIDDASRLNGGAAAGVSGVQDALNRAAERGLSDFHRRHNLTGSIIYKLPFRGHVLTRDWQVNSILRLYSGTPVSPEIQGASLLLGEATRPDRIGSGKLDNPTPERWYNVDHFPEVPEGSFRFGNTGRNVVIGPSRKHFSVSVMRYFPMPKEGHRLQFRWEVFNVPNFTNFFPPEERVNVKTAGAIARARDPRVMQVALKYIF
ncbi:TonB-dependent receptor, partial [Acidobacteria bacterium AH-259-O06]|nr:TonB-dependent receptor [Acidobacteria bacterium AH-259-O06]